MRSNKPKRMCSALLQSATFLFLTLFALQSYSISVKVPKGLKVGGVIGEAIDDGFDSAGDSLRDARDDLQLLWDRLTGNEKDNFESPNLEVQLLNYNGALLAGTGTCGTYFSPDGGNIRGGGNSVRVNSSNRKISSMHEYNNGVIANWAGDGAYWSPNGNRLDGSGESQKLLSVDQYTGLKILSADDNGILFQSITSKSTQRTTTKWETIVVGGGSARFPSEWDLTTSFDSKTYYASNLSSITSPSMISHIKATLKGEGGIGKETTLTSGFEFDSMSLLSIIKAGNKYIASKTDGVSGIVVEYASFSDLLNDNYQIIESRNSPINQFFQYNSGIGAIYEDGLVVWSPNASDFTGTGTGKTLYDGEKKITSIVPFNSQFVPIAHSDILIPLRTPGGLMIGLDNGNVYYSPSGENLIGGGNTVTIATIMTTTALKDLLNSGPKELADKVYLMNHGSDKILDTSLAYNTSANYTLYFFELNGLPSKARVYRRNAALNWDNKGIKEKSYSGSGRNLVDGIKVKTSDRCIYVASDIYYGTEPNVADYISTFANQALYDHFGIQYADYLPFKDYIPGYELLTVD